MFRNKKVNQLTFFNVILFVALLGSLEYFFLTAGQMLFPHFPYLTHMGEILMVAMLALLTIETVLVFKLDGKENSAHFLTPLMLTHLPWFLGFALPWVISMNLPDPHNFLFRKVQILFGLMWMTHLFVFAAWLLWRARFNHKPISKTFAVVAAFFFVGTTLWTTQCDTSGDEPHYMLMAYSLIHDHDLDLTNNYQNRDYESFYHRGTLEPQGLEHVIDGRRYSHHPLGPVLVILPGFLLLGRLGAALTMALLTALALYLSMRILELTGAKGWPLEAVGAIGLFSSPFLLFAGLIFPEIPSACLTALTLYLFLKKRWFWLGVTLGGFLWMHNRNVLLVIPFLLLMAYEIWKDEKTRLKHGGLLAAGFGIPILLLVGYFYIIYGVLTPLGAHNEPFTSLFPFNHFWIGFFGLILDQECGLWFHFSIFAIAITGAVVLRRSHNPLKYLVLGTFIFYYLFMSFYENLGLTPATRYMVSVTPLLLFMLYYVLNEIKKFSGWEVLTIFSFSTGLLMNWVLAVIPWMRYNKLQGENMLLKILGNIFHTRLTLAEPAFQAPSITEHTYVLSFFWVLVTIILTLWFLRDDKKL